MEAPRAALLGLAGTGLLSEADEANEAWTDLEWMQGHANALFPAEPGGRLAPGAEVPRFFFGLTRLGNLWRLRADLPPARVVELARLAGREPAPTDLDVLPERAPSLRERLEADAPLSHVFFGAAFRFPGSLPAAPDAEGLGPEEVALVVEAFPELAARLEESQPCCGICLDDQIVAVGFTAARGGGFAEAGVETHPGFRRRGFGSRAVAAWARAVRGRGEQPLYAAALSDKPALGLARRLDLIRFGSDLRFR